MEPAPPVVLCSGPSLLGVARTTRCPSSRVWSVVYRDESDFGSPLRLAELTSSVGAGVLGIGLGAYFGGRIHSLAIPVLIAGAAMHALGMLDKHRLERSLGVARPWWSTALYWLCWATLAALAAAVVQRLM